MKKNYGFLMICMGFLLFGCSISDIQLPPEVSAINDITQLKSAVVQTDSEATGNSSDKGLDLKSGKKQPLKFEGNFNLWSEPIGTGSPLALEIFGSGNATRLGKTELIIYEDITVIDTLIGGIEKTVWEASATVEATASNGDKLYFSYSCPIDVSETPDYIFEAEATITGGTGRFKNASGDISVDKRFRWDTATGKVSFSGDIEY